MLGFFSAKVPKEASYNFPFYSVQDLNWAGVPKGTEVDNFLSEGCNLLYVLGGPAYQHFHYLGQVKRADLRVGPFTYESDPENFYNVQYISPRTGSIKDTLEHIDRLFNIINAKETATV